jgi:hypothetical protein
MVEPEFSLANAGEARVNKRCMAAVKAIPLAGFSKEASTENLIDFKYDE